MDNGLYALALAIIGAAWVAATTAQPFERGNARSTVGWIVGVLVTALLIYAYVVRL